jgi:hypothetical protein
MFASSLISISVCVALHVQSGLKSITANKFDFIHIKNKKNILLPLSHSLSLSNMIGSVVFLLRNGSHLLNHTFLATKNQLASCAPSGHLCGEFDLNTLWLSLLY